MVTGEYPPAVGGVGDYTRLLSLSLHALGYSVGVLTTAVTSAPKNECGEISVSRSVRTWGPECLGAVASEARSMGADVVHLQYQAAAYQLRGYANILPAYLRLRIPNLKVVTTFHDLLVPYLFPKAAGLRRAAVMALDRFSDLSVLTNPEDLRRLGGPAGGKRWMIRLGSNVPLLADSSFDRAQWRATRLGADDDTLVLGYFGLLNHSKGVDLLIDALVQISDLVPSAKLVIIGGGVGATDPTNQESAKSLLRMIDGTGMASRVIHTGFLPPAEASAYLLSSDICVLPFRDGASLRRGSLLAALEHGRPVVTTVPEHDEPLLREGEAVLMVSRDDPGAIAETVVSLWRDQDRMASLSRGASALAARFSWSGIAGAHSRLYDSMFAPPADSR